MRRIGNNISSKLYKQTLFLSRVIGSELVQKYVGEGARMVRELFEMARTKKACLIFFDEIDAVGGARYAILNKFLA